MRRIEAGVTRPPAITIEIDGVAALVFPGETVAVAVLALSRRFRDDCSGEPRGMFCNMGTCSECTVWISRENSAWRQSRGCLVAVEPGIQVRTSAPKAIS